ncbi:LytR/AlgR family response regulator transcription factor [Mangrovimonas futianensis]|uniref:LytR/AlgR family response regulator transcription factor n=1 Tax=Mangrovimonas futianensis TaxID=2895523 RepID=UPI001E5DC63F|nr:LytTR family DNA-binding domain-containing protein [Mangrovimonas futianensis]MCF1421918.1 LytTR family DNA-binding domain-containing protein [Mangrovimonas futianensis]
MDRELGSAQVLKKHIHSICQMKLLGLYQSSAKAMIALRRESIDLIFLDVGLPDQKLMVYLNELVNPPKVIFTSSNKNRSIEAFSFNALDYLSKPILYDRFLESLTRYFNHYYFKSHELNGLNKEYLYFKADRKMIKVFIENINYIECFKDYIVIHSVDQKQIRVKQTLCSTEALLPKHLFVRVHRSFIVAVNRISAFSSKEIEIGDVSIPIGRNYGHISEQLLQGEI